MKLQRLSIQGFRGIRDNLELDIPAGFLVICGRNGAGKSTLCDAIEFALTGKIRESSKVRDSARGRDGSTVQERGEDYSDYLWWRGSTSSDKKSVSLTLGSDSDVYEFVRDDFNELKGVDTGVLFDKEKAPNDALIQLIRTSLVRDESITEFSVDLPERDRFEFAKNAIGQMDVSPYLTKAESVSDIALDRARAYEADYNSCRDRVSELTARLSDLKSTQSDSVNIDQAQVTLTSILGQTYATIGDLLKNAKSDIVRLRNSVESLNAIANDVRHLIDRQKLLNSDSYVQQSDSLNKAHSDKEGQIREWDITLKEIVAHIAEYDKASNLHRSLSELESHGRKLGLQDGHCPLCGLPIGEKEYLLHLDNVKNDIMLSASALGEYVQTKNVISDKISKAKEELRLLSAEISRQNEMHSVFSRDLIDMKAKIVDLQLPDESDVDKWLDHILVEIDKRRREIVALGEAVSALEASSTTESIQKIEQEIVSIKSDAELYYQQMSRAKNVQNRAKATIRTLNRYAGEIVDEQLSAISPLLSEIFSRLKPHVDWKEVNYRMRGDVRRFLSLTIGGNLNPSFMFSSGQRRALGLAFLISVYLARPWAKLRSIILDDPVQHIDDYRALHLTETLAAIRKQGHQVICTVEDPALGELLCRRLRSTVEEPGALVELEYRPGYGTTVLSKRNIIPMNQSILRAS